MAYQEIYDYLHFLHKIVVMCSVAQIVLMTTLMFIGGVSIASDVENQSRPETQVVLPVEVPILNINKQYETTAKQHEGVVLVGFFVNHDGIVSDISILESSQPGAWDAQVIQRVRNLNPSDAKPGYQEMVFGFTGE